jgi:cyclohexanecarboxylate-CoA ligase
MLPAMLVERFSPHWGGETLLDRARAIVAEHGDRVALIGQTEHRFGDLFGRAERLAGRLAALGVRHGDVVSWQLPNRWEAAVVHLAALRLGAVSNPLNPVFREREMRLIVAAARPRALVVPRVWRGFDHATLAASLDVPVVLVVDDLIDEPATPPPAEVEPSDIAVLLFTSGTTGEPKGVLHSHRALIYQIATFRAAHALTPDDRYLGGPPVAHIAGLSYGILAPFALGTSTVLLERWDPPAAARALAEHGATFMTGPPTFLLTLAQHAADVEHFRLFSTGGATISTDAIRAAGARLGCSVKRAYGSTEIPFLTATAMDDDESARLETDGRALGANEITIGAESEIVARGPGMFEGYLGADALRDGWFHTGDAGAIDERGYLRVTGRLKDIIIRGGENVSAKELEDLIAEHPAVAEVAVIGVPDARLGERVCAVVVARDGASIDFEGLTAFLRARQIATHKLPERLDVVLELPKTESGKVLKADLRASRLD